MLDDVAQANPPLQWLRAEELTGLAVGAAKSAVRTPWCIGATPCVLLTSRLRWRRQQRVLGAYEVAALQGIWPLRWAFLLQVSSWTEPRGAWRPCWEDFFLAAPHGLVLLPWAAPRHAPRSFWGFCRSRCPRYRARVLRRRRFPRCRLGSCCGRSGGSRERHRGRSRSRRFPRWLCNLLVVPETLGDRFPRNFQFPWEKRQVR